MRIKRLSPETINQIAAGEVVENPASVVKELVENGIDAGATEICIEIRSGGLHLIRVTDNGSGMDRDDALLSLERHATSKIVMAEDLFGVETMGFRGEALAAISSISRLTLVTAIEVGTKIEVEGGVVLSIELASRNRGTTVEVRDLFFNVPARKKFQKSPQVSTAEVTRLVGALSLAYPEVGFKLISQDQEIFSVGAETLLKRSQIVLGERGEFLELRGKGVTGVIAPAGTDRHNRTGQFIFLNRRYVQSAPISYAVKEGYGMRLARDRHPIFVLHLTLPGHLVDVNVHPQKREVRLKDEGQIRDQIKRAISQAFEPVRFEISPTSFPQMEWVAREEGPVRMYRPAELPWETPYQFLGLYDRYLIAQAQEKLLFVDIAAASRKLAFEELSEKRGGKQALLIPCTVKLTAAQMAIVEQNGERFEEFGISVRPFGKETAIVEAIAPFISEDEIEPALLDLLAHLEEGEIGMARSISRFARKKRFALHEAEKLFRDLIKRGEPYLCPEGRPIIHTLTPDAIEKLFS